jgi:hypothetical protein
VATGTWLADLAYTLGQERTFENVAFSTNARTRIGQARNQEVRDAARWNASHILFLDPDMIPDAYVGKDPNAKPYWATYWGFMRANPGTVLGVPACGAPPEEKVQVFGKTPDGDVARVPREVAATARGWQRVTRVGSAVLLIDMDVFAKLEPPYFSDVYEDKTETELESSQDFTFCRQCEEKGVPIYVNFDCWADHQHFTTVKRPGWR